MHLVLMLVHIRQMVKIPGNKIPIDWAKVKNSGCKYAILKIIRKDLAKDTMYDRNVIGCTQNNIPFDVYNYSYATTVDKFILDANVVINTLGGRKCTVWLDIEDKTQLNLGQTLIDGILAYPKGYRIEWL